MNKIYKIFLILVLCLSLTHCTISDPAVTEIVLNDFTVQRNTDNAKIETFLKTHSISVDANYDVTFDKETNQALSIWGSGTAHGTNLLERKCISNNIEYTLYYLNLRQGVNTTKKPCNLDGVFTAYKGRLMDDVAPNTTLPNKNVGTIFDSNDNPTDYFNLDAVIRGWSEIFPLFAPGTYFPNTDGTNTYANFGAGVMFIPSGLAYFNGAPGVIPSYSPLIFNFKLYEVRRNDHDFDGIEDFNENLDGEQFAASGNTMKGSYIYTSAANVVLAADLLLDDTDKDGIPNAYDQDDDNDRYPTRNECKKPDLIPVQYDSNGVKINTGYFDFANIPGCTAGLKRHLDINCHQ
jgi:FKBP-type peptidyl-prolyl cis-trans isomerase